MMEEPQQRPILDLSCQPVAFQLGPFSAESLPRERSERTLVAGIRIRFEPVQMQILC